MHPFQDAWIQFGVQVCCLFLWLCSVIHVICCVAATRVWWNNMSLWTVKGAAQDLGNDGWALRMLERGASISEIGILMNSTDRELEDIYPTLVMTLWQASFSIARDKGHSRLPCESGFSSIRKDREFSGLQTVTIFNLLLIFFIVTQTKKRLNKEIQSWQPGRNLKLSQGTLLRKW